MQPALSYAQTADGVSIAYFTMGRGPAVVFASNVWGDANMYAAPHPHTRYMTDRLVDLGWQVVRYDLRGMGSSQRDVTDLSLEPRVLDIDAVARELGLTRFAVAGVDSAVPVALAYAAANPERVIGVAALNGFPSGKQRLRANAAARAVTSLMEENTAGDWDFYTIALAKLVTELDNPAHTRELAALFRRSSSWENLYAVHLGIDRLDMTPWLETVRVPVLVVQDTGFPFGSLESCRGLASRLPNARLLTVYADRDAEVEAMDAFLRSCLEPSSAGEAIRAPLSSGLTPRELEVLRLIAAGRTNREISNDLVLSIRTVARHVTNVYAKIGSRSRAEATAYAYRHCLN
jgi:DNA-binding CsgD family transcriptional regulator/pimeloyl-ACP methyl ester carboxylesterase